MEKLCCLTTLNYFCSMNRESNLLYHFVAFVTVAIWGTTFVWTKLLIQNGLSPAQIFTIRFLIAYVMLLVFSLIRVRKHKYKWFADNWKDELTMVALGVTGGSLYFLTETRQCYILRPPTPRSLYAHARFSLCYCLPPCIRVRGSARYRWLALCWHSSEWR